IPTSFCSPTGIQPSACVASSSIPIANEKKPSGNPLPIGRRKMRTCSSCGRPPLLLIGQPPDEHVEGVWGNREVPPNKTKEGGNVGETWFPPREQAAGERRSCARRDTR